jgi:hypothetical protein
VTPALLDGQAPPMARTVVPPEHVPACAACTHPLEDHDAIATRFCRATVTARLDRGCVCQA